MNKLRLTALTITMSFLPFLMANTKIDNSNTANQVEHALVVANINNDNNEYVLDTFNEETRQDQEQFEYYEEKENKQAFVLEPTPYFYLLVAIALLIMPGLPIILAIIFAIRNKRRNRCRLENAQKE